MICHLLILETGSVIQEPKFTSKSLQNPIKFTPDAFGLSDFLSSEKKIFFRCGWLIVMHGEV